MSRVFAFVPYTAAFTPALLKYRAKIERSMITNPTCVKMRNFSAAYRRFGPPQMPIREKIGVMKRSQKNPKSRRARGMKTPTNVISRERKRAKKARGRASPAPREKKAAGVHKEGRH